MVGDRLRVQDISAPRKEVSCPFTGRLDGPHNEFRHVGKEKTLNTFIENRTPDVSTHDSTSTKCKHRYDFPARRWGISVSIAVPISVVGPKRAHNLGGAHSPCLYMIHPNFEPSTERVLKPGFWFAYEVKANPLTDLGGPQGCETSRLPHFLDNRLTEGGEVVSLTRRPPFTPRKIPGTHFC
jgi:hypothetical protein